MSNRAIKTFEGNFQHRWCFAFQDKEWHPFSKPPSMIVMVLWLQRKSPILPSTFLFWFHNISMIRSSVAFLCCSRAAARYSKYQDAIEQGRLRHVQIPFCLESSSTPPFQLSWRWSSLKKTTLGTQEAKFGKPPATTSACGRSLRRDGAAKDLKAPQQYRNSQVFIVYIGFWLRDCRLSNHGFLLMSCES